MGINKIKQITHKCDRAQKSHTGWTALPPPRYSIPRDSTWFACIHNHDKLNQNYMRKEKKTYNFYHLSWLHAISTFSIIRRKKIQYPKQRTTAAKWTTRMPKEAMAWDLQKWCTIGFSDLFPQFRTPALVASYTPFYLQPNPVQCLTTLQGPGNTNDTRYYQNCRRSTNNWINQSNKRQ
jgi:hypothetical protein